MNDETNHSDQSLPLQPTVVPEVAGNVTDTDTPLGTIETQSGNSETPTATWKQQPGEITGMNSDFEKYADLEIIGRGGMGVVYRARHVELKRNVAIKMISGAAASPEQIKRFQREAESAARLDHPGIVPVYEFGESDGRPFFAMGYIEGRDLASVIRESPLTGERAAELLEQIAEAIHYAHTHGIVHRDLKPANILLDTGGYPRITDFGIARHLGPEATQVTGTGEILGTPSYMPPEQATGVVRSIGPRSDVYALGAVLYHMVTGRPPFLGDSVHATILQLLHDEPVPPRRLQPQVPRDLDTICLKCLEKDPERRYESADALRDDLRSFQLGRPISARPIGRLGRAVRWARRQPIVAGLLGSLALAIVVGVTAVVVQWRRAEQNFDLSEVNRKKAVESGRREKSARLLADAEKKKAETSRDNLRRQFYNISLRNAAEAIDRGHYQVARQLLTPFIPKDGEPDIRTFAWHYLWRNHRIVSDMTLPLGYAYKNNPKILLKSSFAVSPNGRLVAIGRPEGVVLLDARTGEVSQPLAGTTKSRTLAFSADGTRLAFAQTKSAREFVVVWNLKAGRLEKTLQSRFKNYNEQECNLQFSKDAKRLVAYHPSQPVAAIWRIPEGDLVHDGFVAKETKKGRKIGKTLRKQPDGSYRPSHTVLRHSPISDIWIAPDQRSVMIADVESGVFRWTQSSGFWRRILDDAIEVRPYDVKKRMSGVAFSDDGEKLLVADGNTLATWSIITGKKVRTDTLDHPDPNTGHHQRIDHGTLLRAAGGTVLWSSVERRKFTVWDPQKGVRLESLARFSNPIDDFGILEKQLYYTVTSDNRLIVWRARNRPSEAVIAELPSQNLMHFGRSRDGRLLASGASLPIRKKSYVTVWEVDNRRKHRAFPFPRTTMAATTTSRELTRIAYRNRAGSIVVRDMSNGKPLLEVQPQQGHRILRHVLSSDGTLLSYAESADMSNFSYCKVVEVQGGKEITSQRFPNGIMDLCDGPPRCQFVLTDSRGDAIGWDRNARTWSTYPSHQKSSRVFAISPTGRFAARVQSGVNWVVIHDWKKRTEARITMLEAEKTGKILFSPDGRTVLIEIVDAEYKFKAIAVADPESGQQTARIRPSEKLRGLRLGALTFSKDGLSVYGAFDPNLVVRW